jgi:hypothetical protein
VRALEGWAEVEALIKNVGAPPTPAPAPTAVTKAAAPDLERPVEPIKRAAEPAPAKTPPAPAFEEEPLPATFSGVEPAGLVYDAVSRRFIIANRAENNLIIYDDVFKRATSMVSAESAGFFGLRAIEIDAHRGDLWVVNSSADRGATVHKLQLVSGRVLFEVPMPAELAPAALVDAAVRDDGQVLLLDAQGGRILGVSPGHRNVDRIASIDIEAPTSLALANGKVVFVAHRKGLLRVDVAARTVGAVRNAPAGLVRIRSIPNGLVGVQTDDTGVRLVRLRLDPSGGRVVRADVLDPTPSISDPAGITVANGFVYYVTTAGGAPAIRRVRTAK